MSRFNNYEGFLTFLVQLIHMKIWTTKIQNLHLELFTPFQLRDVIVGHDSELGEREEHVP